MTRQATCPLPECLALKLYVPGVGILLLMSKAFGLVTSLGLGVITQI